MRDTLLDGGDDLTRDVDALNYPYIRIRNVDWLKRTLLIFPHVVRMTPEWGAPPDDPEIQMFCELEGRRGPLLRRARLYSDNVYRAQIDLIQKIQRRLVDDPWFPHRFGRRAIDQTPSRVDSVWDDRAKGQSFQLHESKMTSELAGFLRANELGWDPWHSHSPGYVEMSPGLGRAVMATLAFACAEDEGLTLVTEFPDIFGRVIHQTKDSVFDVCLKGDSRPQQQSGDDLFELLVYQRCDPTKLTPERIQALNLESEAWSSFKKQLEKAARSLPRVMVDRERREQRLHDTISDIFRKWEKDRANLSNYVRAVFGEGVLEQPEKLLEKVADAALGAPAAAGAIVGGLTTSSLIGASAGFAVGVATHAAESFFQIKKTEKESPFRYLTLLEKDGVGFVVSK